MKLLVGLVSGLYVVACLLPSEPSGSERIEFQLDFAVPYRVPLAATVEPTIRITAGGQALSNPHYRLESLDPEVLRLDTTGRALEGVARGSAFVRVVYQTATGAPDTVFPVQVVVSRIAVGPSSTTLTRLGATTQLSATAYDAKDATVPDVAFTWSSADPHVAIVNDTGLVRAVDEGTVTIAAEADGVMGSSQVSVTQLAAAVRIAPELDSLRTLGRATRFFAVAFDDTGGVLRTARPRWTSSDASVARVDSAGLATATGVGTARIIARVGAAADTATLVVTQVVRLLVVTPGFDTLTAIADTGRLVGLAFDSLNFAILNPIVGWSTSDAAVATVDQAGLVQATKNGVALITAASGGQSAFATMVVRQEVARARISPDNVTLAGIGATVQLSAVALDRNGHPVTGAAFAWRSSSECVATVDGGLVTARGGGEAAVTAMSVNRGQSDTSIVSVTGAPGGTPDIAFASPRGIEALCSGGGGRTLLVGSSIASEPAWSPDGSKIAFTVGCGEIWTAASDGSRARSLISVNSDRHCDSSPAWSPDGTKIAFVRSDLSPWVVAVYVADSDGSNARRLGGNESAFWSNPAWSPDGTKLAIAVYQWWLDHGLIAVVNADGTGWSRVTPRSGVQGEVNTEPAWSPDGSQLAFQRDGHLWLINPDGSGARALTPGQEPAWWSQEPAWSPDGSRVVFVRWDGSQYDLYVINRDGTGLQRLTSTPENEFNPTWRSAAPPLASQGATVAGRLR